MREKLWRKIILYRNKSSGNLILDKGKYKINLVLES